MIGDQNCVQLFYQIFYSLCYTEDIASFDPVPAIEMWNISIQRFRRPSQAPYGRREDCDDVEDNVDNFSVLDHHFDKENR